MLGPVVERGGVEGGSLGCWTPRPPSAHACSLGAATEGLGLAVLPASSLSPRPPPSPARHCRQVIHIQPGARPSLRPAEASLEAK